PAGATVFVVDRSRSMNDDDASAVAAQVAQALASAGDEPVGLVAFAEHSAVVYPVGALQPGMTAATIAEALRSADTGSGDYTDIASALRLAASLPAAGGRRLVLFSDGRETIGQAADWAAGVAHQGVTIDAVRPAAPPASDVRLTDVQAPSSTWQGDEVEVNAAVASDLPTSATVQLLVDGQETGTRQIDLPAGTANARFVLQPLAPGFHAIAVRVAPQGNDPVPQNNTLATTTIVRDKPHVLIIEGTKFTGDRLRRALVNTSFIVDVKDPTALTERLSDLAVYDAIVLDDVPASAISAERQQALQEYVRSLGRGLVVTGGSQSFGSGDYAGSTLEDVLPVQVKPRGTGQRPPAALMLVIDVSFSMNTPNTGPTRIEMAKTAAENAVRALSPGDEVGVLAFSDNNEWVTRLRKINSQSDIDDIVNQISRLKADGVTQMYPALTAALDELSHSQAHTRHLILLSDGAPSTPFNPDSVTSQAKRNNATISTIAIGDGADLSLMEKIATSRDLAHFARTPEEIPGFVLQEAKQLGGRTLATGEFQAVQTAPSPIMRGLDPAKLPTLDGYQITETKPDAQMILASGQDEPILAQWQYGLGRVVAWTSDLSQDLAANWKSSDAFGVFWNQAVRWTLPAAVSPYFRVSASQVDKDTVIAVDAFDDNGLPVDLADTRAQLRTPTGATVEIALVQSAPGRYEARLAAPATGAYSLALRQTRGGQVVTDTAGFNVPYPAELRGPAASDSALGALADRTGGQVLDLPEQVFGRPNTASAPHFVLVWQPFAALGLLLFVLDIALRLRHAATPDAILRRLLPR
ncbi:MAG: VWA domain-containing protein, partial [Thermomicrobiales bacterium]